MRYCIMNNYFFSALLSSLVLTVSAQQKIQSIDVLVPFINNQSANNPYTLGVTFNSKKDNRKWSAKIAAYANGGYQSEYYYDSTFK
jgi:hypothetical protein